MSRAYWFQKCLSWLGCKLIYIDKSRTNVSWTCPLYMTGQRKIQKRITTYQMLLT